MDYSDPLGGATIGDGNREVSRWMTTCAALSVDRSTPTLTRRQGTDIRQHEEQNPMQIQYLEIVTNEVDATCATYSKTLGVTFSAPEPGLGGARTAALSSGGKIGVRAPMHESETPVVRPYLLVPDIEAAAQAAAAAGGEIAHPPMELPGHGKFAIYIQGGVHHGLWQK